jgi:hypothetical protein
VQMAGVFGAVGVGMAHQGGFILLYGGDQYEEVREE